jgi:small GTP-binding protein
MKESEFNQKIGETYDQNIRLLDTRLNIAVVGKVSAGKSSLINAIFQKDRSDPLAAVGSTSGVTTELNSYPLCDYVTVIDCPGLNDIRAENSKVTEDFLRSIDIGILVFSGSADASQKAVFDDLKEKCNYVFAVLNKIDEWDDLEESALQAVQKQWKEVLGISEIFGTCAKGYDPKTRKDAPMDIRGVDKLRDAITSFLETERKVILFAKHLKQKDGFAFGIIASAISAAALGALLPLSTVTITSAQLYAIAALVFLYNGVKLDKAAIFGILGSFAAQSVGTSLFLFVKSFLPPTGIVDAAAAITAACFTFAILYTVHFMLRSGHDLNDREKMREIYERAKMLGFDWKSISLEDFKNKDKMLKLIKKLFGALSLK